MCQRVWFCLLLSISSFLLTACDNTAIKNYEASPEYKKRQEEIAKEKQEQDGWKRLFNKTLEYASLDPPSKPSAKTSVSEGLIVISTLKGDKDQILFQRILGFEEKDGKISRAIKKEDDPYPTFTIKGRAETPEEVAIIVQQNCREGKKIGTYELSGSDFGLVDLVGVDCNIRIIDNKLKAVVVERKFSNNKVQSDVVAKSYGGMLIDQKVVNPPPYKEIADFIEKTTGVKIRKE